LPIGVLGLYLLELWSEAAEGGIIHICDGDGLADRIGATIHALNQSANVLVLPSLGPAQFEDVEPSPVTAGRRSSVLRRMAEGKRPILVIGSVEAFSSQVPLRDRMKDAGMRMAVGDRFDEEAVTGFLSGSGYVLDEQVAAPGMAFAQPNLMEIFSAGALDPIRINHDGGQVVGIHTYDLSDQRQLEILDEVVVDAVDEWAFASDRGAPKPSHAMPFDYAPSAIIVSEEGAYRRAERRHEGMERRRKTATSKKGFGLDALRSRIGHEGSDVPSFEPAKTFFADASSGRSLRRYIALQRHKGWSVIFAAASKKDLRTVERRAGLMSRLVSDWQEARDVASGQPAALLMDLDRGFVLLEQNTVVIAAADVLGSRATRQDAFNFARRIDSESRVKMGDAVIHLERGVAIMKGLAEISMAGTSQSEMIRLEFAEEESTLLPLSDLRAIWLYSSDADGVTLDNADGGSWAKRRVDSEADILAAVEAVAMKMAERSRDSDGSRIQPPATKYEEFAAGFEYVTTTAQSDAINDVLDDLAAPRRMDRLICGDVGYGKTEVALRAAAAAVFSGFQAAVIVPTTVLARQHLETFRRRFEPFGISVGGLTRFTSGSDARQVKAAIADGSMPIVIGTHALAGKGIEFVKLGLVILDEEQHFGRAQKEKLGSLADGVNLLTMTATPIPATMNEALAGLRALSVIDTPPVSRLPVATVVEPYHDAGIASALRREHRRRGQSFVVCPRIEDIAPMEQRLRELVPELKVLSLHGKMRALDIDNSMMLFADGEADVLLATNIIESGLDIPKANTIVVWRPDKFGLAALHQLRGRVGRRGTRAFASFLTDPDTPLSSAGRKRLDALLRAQGQGAGFRISAGDLDLRGSGDLSSDEQSGHVRLLGAELSSHLMDLAMHGGKDRIFQRLPTFNIGVQAHFPPSYIADDGLRLEQYVRMFKAGGETDLDDVENVLEDRFGELPAEAINLVGLARLQLACVRLGITAIDAGPKSIAATFVDSGPVLLRKKPGRHEILKWVDDRLVYRKPTSNADRMAALLHFIEEIDQGYGPA
jgi:transcription-repair coupling factor (superfamily II helicase)